MPHLHDGSNILVPSPGDATACGGYTGFNSLDLQQIYRVEKLPACRSQIAVGYGKPALVCLPGGDLLATGFLNHSDDPDYTYPDGSRAHSCEWWTIEEAALMRSADDGQTWSEPRLLGFPGRPTQLSCLPGGTLIMAVLRELYRSTDEGQSWTRCDVPWDEFAPAGPLDLGFGETGGIVQAPDGTLICSCFAHRSPQQTVHDWNSFIIRSRDDGQKWGDPTFVVNTDEVSYLQMPDGRLLGFARVDTMYSRDIWGISGQSGEGGDTVALMESSDLGRSWSEPRRIGLGMAQVPAFPLRLGDGRLLLVYGNRQFPFGCQVVASRDAGATWDLDHPLVLSWFGWDNYGGHPRSLLMPDGSIITGYYVRMFKEDSQVSCDLASHVVRWRPPDDWP